MSTAFLPCCFGCSHVFIFASYLTFFCVLDSYVYWLGIEPFARVFPQLHTLYLAGLVRSFVCWYLTVFVMRVNNHVSCPLGHSHVLFLQSPVVSYSASAVTISTIWAPPCTSGIVCVMLLWVLFSFWPWPGMCR